MMSSDTWFSKNFSSQSQSKSKTNLINFQVNQVSKSKVLLKISNCFKSLQYYSIFTIDCEKFSDSSTQKKINSNLFHKSSKA